MKQFDLREHTADVAVEARGGTLGEVFAAVADGLTAAMCEEVPEGGERLSFEIAAESREALLFDYLDEIIYLRDAHEVLPADHEALVRKEGDEREPVDERETAVEREPVGERETAVERETEDGRSEERIDDDDPIAGDGRWVLEGTFRAVPFSDVVARDVKAVTYSEMRLEPVDGAWEAYVVFDV